MDEGTGDEGRSSVVRGLSSKIIGYVLKYKYRH